MAKHMIARATITTNPVFGSPVDLTNPINLLLAMPKKYFICFLYILAYEYNLFINSGLFFIAMKFKNALNRDQQ